VPLVRGCRVPWCPNYDPCPAHPPPPRHAHYPPLPTGWPVIRAAQLAAFPLCEDCGQPATDVDHRHGRAAGDAPGNLRSLCHPCHATRTGRAGGQASA
jgi:hypothetical protein